MTVLAATLVLLCTTASSGTGRTASAAAEDFWLGPRELVCETVGRSDDTSVLFAIPPLVEPRSIRLNTLPARPDEVWIDLSLFNNGFAPGTFLGRGPIPVIGEPALVPWDNLLAGRMHYYRVNARVGAQWYVYERGAFETPDCNNVLRLFCDEAESNAVHVAFAVHQPGILERNAPVETWLDLSLSNNNFRAGTFIGAGPFPGSPPFGEPYGTLFEWRNVQLAGRHYWRTNTLFRPSGWLTQRQGSFLSLQCNTLLRTP